MADKSKQGQNAQKHGVAFERECEQMLVDIAYAHELSCAVGAYRDRDVIMRKQCAFTVIRQHRKQKLWKPRARVDFVLRITGLRVSEHIIEVKSQSGGGSVDEKIVHVLRSFEEAIKRGESAHIVLSGVGFVNDAIEWARNEAHAIMKREHGSAFVVGLPYDVPQIFVHRSLNELRACLEAHMAQAGL